MFVKWEVYGEWYMQMIGFMFGLIYWRQPLNQLSIDNINGALYLMISQMSFGFIFNVIMVW